MLEKLGAWMWCNYCWILHSGGVLAFMINDFFFLDPTLLIVQRRGGYTPKRKQCACIIVDDTSGLF